MDQISGDISYACMCTKYTCIYLHATHIFLPKSKSKRCERNTKNSNPYGFKLQRPSIGSTKLLFIVHTVIIIIIRKTTLYTYSIYGDDIHLQINAYTSAQLRKHPYPFAKRSLRHWFVLLWLHHKSSFAGSCICSKAFWKWILKLFHSRCFKVFRYPTDITLAERLKPIFTNPKERSKHIELPAKLLDYFLRSNKSNINRLRRASPPKAFFCWKETAFLNV